MLIFYRPIEVVQPILGQIITEYMMYKDMKVLLVVDEELERHIHLVTDTIENDKRTMVVAKDVTGSYRLDNDARLLMCLPHAKIRGIKFDVIILPISMRRTDDVNDLFIPILER